MKERVQEYHLAGSWYPRDREELDRQISHFLSQVTERRRKPKPLGLIVPHAGYQYSGKAAACGYAVVRGEKFRRVVVIAPSHYVAFPGGAIPPVDFFSTPLGNIPVDQTALRTLCRHYPVREDPTPYAQEHALEIQLPFLQKVLTDFRLVPLILSDLEREDYDQLTRALQLIVDTDTLVVISSDFTHYGSRFGYLPFPPTHADAVRQGLRDLDGGALEKVVAGDFSGFQSYVVQTGITICGRVPVALFLKFLEAATTGEVLCYYTSLDVTGDYRHSVSYAAVAFPRGVIGDQG